MKELSITFQLVFFGSLVYTGRFYWAGVFSHTLVYVWYFVILSVFFTHYFWMLSTCHLATAIGCCQQASIQTYDCSTITTSYTFKRWVHGVTIFCQNFFLFPPKSGPVSVTSAVCIDPPGWNLGLKCSLSCVSSVINVSYLKHVVTQRYQLNTFVILWL